MTDANENYYTLSNRAFLTAAFFLISGAIFVEVLQ